MAKYTRKYIRIHTVHVSKSKSSFNLEKNTKNKLVQEFKLLVKNWIISEYRK